MSKKKVPRASDDAHESGGALMVPPGGYKFIPKSEVVCGRAGCFECFDIYCERCDSKDRRIVELEMRNNDLTKYIAHMQGLLLGTRGDNSYAPGGSSPFQGMQPVSGHPATTGFRKGGPLGGAVGDGGRMRAAVGGPSDLPPPSFDVSGRGALMPKLATPPAAAAGGRGGFGGGPARNQNVSPLPRHSPFYNAGGGGGVGGVGGGVGGRGDGGALGYLQSPLLYDPSLDMSYVALTTFEPYDPSSRVGGAVARKEEHQGTGKTT